MSQALLDVICSTDNLPSLPTVAIDVLRLTREEDTSIGELAGIIQNDPALTAKMLKVVNSALFGVPREIGSIGQTVGLLGLRTVKIMALSFSLVETVRGVQGDTFGFEAYWRRSLTTAVAARLIGNAAALRFAEEAFVAGLLSDIGMIAAWRSAPAIYQPILTESAETGQPMAEIEASRFGFTHAVMSRRLLEAWHLPDALCAAVGGHHGEGLATLSGESLELTRLVHAAATVSGLFCRELPFSQLDSVKAQCAEETGVDQAKLDEALLDLHQHVEDMASLLAVQVGETAHYGQVQTEAAAQLAQLSVQAEVELSEAAKREQAARMEAKRLHDEKRLILEVASTDALTKVANRAAFDAYLDGELSRARAQGHSLGLIMMDIDYFKSFNDTYGHQAGDEVLRKVGMCLSDVASSLGFVARYGGEEFAVVVSGEAAAAIRAMAEEIRTALEQSTVRHNGRELHVTASFGVCRVSPQTAHVTSEQVVERADQRLYHAKQSGRNRVEMAD